MAAILVSISGQTILAANTDPLPGKFFTVTGAKCDSVTGACHQYGDLATCNNAESCWKKVSALWPNRQNISWIIMIPPGGLPFKAHQIKNLPKRLNEAKNPQKKPAFIVTGAKCDPDGSGCYQKGNLAACDSALSCWEKADAILKNYDITWVVLSPQY
jgi:hypothetical protein